MEQKMTQRDMIREHLQRFGSIEPLTALSQYGCYRLGAVIFNLRHDEGLNIETKIVEAKSKITGRPVMFANYILHNDDIRPTVGTAEEQAQAS